MRLGPLWSATELLGQIDQLYHESRDPRDLPARLKRGVTPPLPWQLSNVPDRGRTRVCRAQPVQRTAVETQPGGRAPLPVDPSAGRRLRLQLQTGRSALRRTTAPRC